MLGVVCFPDVITINPIMIDSKGKIVNTMFTIEVWEGEVQDASDTAVKASEPMARIDASKVNFHNSALVLLPTHLRSRSEWNDALKTSRAWVNAIVDIIKGRTGTMVGQFNEYNKFIEHCTVSILPSAPSPDRMHPPVPAMEEETPVYDSSSEAVSDHE